MRSQLKSIIVFAMVTASAMSITNAAERQTSEEQPKSESRSLVTFNAISIKGAVSVNVIQGIQQTVTVQAKEDKMLKYITTKVEDGTLYITIKKNDEFNWENSGTFTGGTSDPRPNKININIIVPDLTAIDAASTSIVNIKNEMKINSLKIHLSQSSAVHGAIHAKRLQGTVEGSGDLKLEGDCDFVNISIAGSAVYKAQGFATINTTIDLQGSCHATINASESITATADGNATLLYTGKAKTLLLNKKSNAVIARLETAVAK